MDFGFKTPSANNKDEFVSSQITFDNVEDLFGERPKLNKMIEKKNEDLHLNKEENKILMQI